jgi:hypothetical protein
MTTREPKQKVWEKSVEEVTQSVPQPAPARVPNALIERFVGWVAYCVVMWGFLLCFRDLSWLEHFGLSIILGHFSQQLNAIKNKL